MRLVISLSGPMETRKHSSEDMCKRSQRSKVKDAEKALHILIQDKFLKFKFYHLKLVLIVVIFGTLATFLYLPNFRHTDHSSLWVSRPNFVKKWKWGRSDPRYTSHLEIDWNGLSRIVKPILGTNKIQTVGLLNFNKTETTKWKELIPKAEHITIQLDFVDNNVTWDLLYPEWIDEEEENEVPICPHFPTVQIPKKRLDFIAVKLPCRNDVGWSRDTARLHLQLAAAQLAASIRSTHPLYLLFITKCFPIPNMYNCKELVTREGNAWLYLPNSNVLRGKHQFPVGSCELSVPLKTKDKISHGNMHREAYATILHSAHTYVCGAIVAAQSIRMAGSTRDLVILVDETISEYHRNGLQTAGWKIRTIRRIRNPKAKKNAYNEWNYSKFRLWQLTDYDKIIFIDADLLILKNIDFLFSMPEISATGNNSTLFNSGVMVLEPSNCTFQLLMDHINEIESYNGGDQGYLNEFFTWWHRIPKHMNFLKDFWIGDDEETKKKKTMLFGSNPPIIHVLHYLGFKPWMCFKDYDCNWNVGIMQEFASDVAHDKWWRVHDAMPEKLQQFCLLRSKQKAQLEWDRREAEKAKFTDGHWKIKIKDPRLRICVDEFCSWKGMLSHWGETNWTGDDSFSTQSLPTISRALLAGL